MDLPLRAHEILEDTLQFQLTGSADQGSGTNLATAAANLDGTQAVLDALAPSCGAAYAGLDQVGVWMGRARRLLKDAAAPAADWTPVALAEDDRSPAAGRRDRRSCWRTRPDRRRSARPGGHHRSTDSARHVPAPERWVWEWRVPALAGAPSGGARPRPRAGAGR